MNNKVKEDCFAYIKRKKECLGLNSLYCKQEDCKFYKTKEQIWEEEQRTQERLKNLQNSGINNIK